MKAAKASAAAAAAAATAATAAIVAAAAAAVAASTTVGSAAGRAHITTKHWTTRGSVVAATFKSAAQRVTDNLAGNRHELTAVWRRSAAHRWHLLAATQRARLAGALRRAFAQRMAAAVQLALCSWRSAKSFTQSTSATPSSASATKRCWKTTTTAASAVGLFNWNEFKISNANMRDEVREIMSMFGDDSKKPTSDDNVCNAEAPLAAEKTTITTTATPTSTSNKAKATELATDAASSSSSPPPPPERRTDEAQLPTRIDFDKTRLIEDKEWKIIYDKKDLIIWRRDITLSDESSPSSSADAATSSGATTTPPPAVDYDLYEYKVLGRFDDVTPLEFYRTQIDLTYRQEWDYLAIYLDVLGRDAATRTELVRWIMRFPYPLYPREYLFVRRYGVDTTRKMLVLVSRCLPDVQLPTDAAQLNSSVAGGADGDNEQTALPAPAPAPLPAAAASSQFVRVTQYKSNIVILPHDDFDTPGLTYVIQYYDVNKAKIPKIAYKWMAASGLPDYIDKVHRAALRLKQRRAVAEAATALAATATIANAANANAPVAAPAEATPTAVEDASGARQRLLQKQLIQFGFINLSGDDQDGGDKMPPTQNNNENSVDDDKLIRTSETASSHSASDHAASNSSTSDRRSLLPASPSSAVDSGGDKCKPSSRHQQLLVVFSFMTLQKLNEDYFCSDEPHPIFFN